jgi:hypothetical protein
LQPEVERVDITVERAHGGLDGRELLKSGIQLREQLDATPGVVAVHNALDFAIDGAPITPE